MTYLSARLLGLSHNESLCRYHRKKARVAPATTVRTDISTSNRAGGTIVDLLTLLAYGSDAPVALLAVRGNGGGWSILSHGLTSSLGLEHDQFFDAASSVAGTMEFADILTLCPSSGLARGPNSLRWGYSTTLEDGNGHIVGLVAVLDCWLRQLSKKTVRVLAVAARQIEIQLTLIHGIAGNDPRPPDKRRHGPDASALPVPDKTLRGSSRPVLVVPKLLRTSDVAAIFQVTDRTVTNWVTAGRLPCTRTVGGRLRFQQSDIMALVEIKEDWKAPSYINELICVNAPAPEVST